MRVKELDLLLTTAESFTWWDIKEDRPELMGLVLLLVLMLGMSPSSGVPIELSDRLIHAENQLLEWPKTMWNSYYESSEEKYSKKVTVKRKGKKPSEYPERRTHLVPKKEVEEKKNILEKIAAK